MSSKRKGTRNEHRSMRLIQSLLDVRGNVNMLPMPEIDAEIAAYSDMQQELEEKCMGKWVLFHQGKLVSVYDSFDDAAKEAVAQFGRGPYLIRQVGAPAVTLPASVMFPLVHA